jgi:hypothetical protein
MLALILAILVILVLFGAGFALHLLWWIAIAAVVLLVLSLVLRGGGRRTPL